MAYFQHHLFFCVNQREGGEACCQDFDALGARDYLKQRVKEAGLNGLGGVRVNTAGCLGRCEKGPALVVYPEGVWYTYVDHADLDEILQSHLIEGRPVERLMI